MTASEFAITFGRWMLTISATLCFLGIIFLTKWWRSQAGINVFCLALCFVFTMAVITFAAFGLIAEDLKDWSLAAIYTSFGIVLYWRFSTIVFYWWRERKNGLQ